MIGLLASWLDTSLAGDGANCAGPGVSRGMDIGKEKVGTGCCEGSTARGRDPC